MSEFLEKNALLLNIGYLVISLVVAVGIWVQIQLLRKNQGKYPDSLLFSLLSTLDTLWVLVSLGVFFWLDFIGLNKIIPAFYLIYAFLGFFYAAHTMNDGRDIPTRPEDLVFAPKYLNFAQSFSIIFFLACGLLLASSFYPIPFVSPTP